MGLGRWVWDRYVSDTPSTCAPPALHVSRPFGAHSPQLRAVVLGHSKQRLTASSQTWLRGADGMHAVIPPYRHHTVRPSAIHSCHPGADAWRVQDEFLALLSLSQLSSRTAAGMRERENGAFCHVRAGFQPRMAVR